MTDASLETTPQLSASGFARAGFSWPESPRWHDGALFVSDMYAARIVRIDESGERSVYVDVTGRETLDGADLVTIGTGFLPDGRLLINSMFEKVTLVWDGSEVSLYADLRALAQGPINDMVVDAEGRAYVTQLGFDLWKGEEPADSPIIVIEPDGSAHLLEGVGGFGGANGIGITADGKTLITAENNALKITAMDLSADGTAQGRRVIHEVPSPGYGIGPDGIAIDEAGGVWYGLPGSEQVVHITAEGEIDSIVHVPFTDGIATACVLGGPDRRTLYIAAGYEVMDREKSVRESIGGILAVDVAVGGGAARP